MCIGYSIAETWASSEADDRYRAAKRAEAKTLVWEEFKETMEKDVWLASRVFWQTIRRLRKGKQGLSQVVPDLSEELLTRTEDIVKWWREHFDDMAGLSWLTRIFNVAWRSGLMPI